MSQLVNTYFNAVKKLIPQQGARSFVGLDIGAGSCKMVELSVQGSQIQLVSWAVKAFGPSGKNQAVRDVMAQVKSQDRSPATAVSGKGTLIRCIDMPRITAEELKQSFSYDADKYFPFPKDEIYTDCFILNPKKRSNEMAVLISASRRELVDERIKFLTDCGLQADHIGLNPVAIANVRNVLGREVWQDGAAPEKRSDTPDEQAVAILDMGKDVCNLTIMIGDLLCFTRDIHTGGNELTRMISRVMNVGMEEAERLKQSPDKHREKIAAAVESLVTNLVSEMRMSFDYFLTENSVAISQLLITGGGSMMDGVAKALNGYLEIPVREWKPVMFLKRAEGIDEQGLNESASVLTVALGLALSVQEAA